MTELTGDQVVDPLASSLSTGDVHLLTSPPLYICDDCKSGFAIMTWVMREGKAGQRIGTGVRSCVVRSIYRSLLPKFFTSSCQDSIHPMYSASVSIVLTCLFSTPPGPDHPWCASGNALTYHCACVSTLWNTVRCHVRSSRSQRNARLSRR